MRSETMVETVKLAIGSSPHPIMDKNHILLAEDLDYTDQNGNVDGKYGRVNPPLVPVGISLLVSNISGASYSTIKRLTFEQFQFLEVQVMN